MPDTQKHISIIEQNFKTIEHLAQPDASKYIDWSVTIIFYMALHYVHAFLSEELDYHPTAHKSLQDTIEKNDKLKPIYKKYRDLQDNSVNARYLGKKFTVYYIRNASLKSFKGIQNHIAQLLSVSGVTKYDLYKLFPLEK